MVAFSGRGVGRDNPAASALQDIGPIPPGTYYLLDRESGGRMGWLYDWVDSHGYGTTDHTKWFMLWNAKSGDATMVNGVTRGEFRLHPAGRSGLSKGCITVLNPSEFDRLARHIRARPSDLPVPGDARSAYGTVEVR
ncbi:DUF2778 domain-containing protein [Paraburkholderia solisilvae]|uniref:DUF2778 domain-containing protein n=1 Tax=Paraburkholderia solisilvae TaxID=624376 RepID=UPI0031B58365